ncbi:MAG: dTMP kinase [Pseudanabaenaceae cyanobacterium SKYGB_i_bin29]|nr:dTMP kinase [Pseudanabaenaceae cyanobacterium SKYG29]MDW8421769.1 dTMP kinase [Pseudanabaenaceae cyanobacterium SKYGB_i_bin29]
MSSLFISFEGGEGAGKSTQAKFLAEFWQAQGYRVVLTREPGGTNLGLTIRQLFLQGEAITPVTELYLLLADRSHHVSHLIRPALAEGKIVITDRFSDSTIAYQGFGHGIDCHLIDNLNRIATGGLVPHLTFWLDVDPQVGLARAKQKHRTDRMEKFNLEFHQRVRDGFQYVWQRETDRVKRIDANLAPEVVRQTIVAVVKKYPLPPVEQRK